ncbi:MAG: hypothetical protein Q6373_006555 [Candidatus Sigynarchaeota archaeon]
MYSPSNQPPIEPGTEIIKVPYCGYRYSARASCPGLHVAFSKPIPGPGSPFYRWQREDSNAVEIKFLTKDGRPVALQDGAGSTVTSLTSWLSAAALRALMFKLIPPLRRLRVCVAEYTRQTKWKPLYRFYLMAGRPGSTYTTSLGSRFVPACKQCDAFMLSALNPMGIDALDRQDCPWCGSRAGIYHRPAHFHELDFDFDKDDWASFSRDCAVQASSFPIKYRGSIYPMDVPGLVTKRFFWRYLSLLPGKTFGPIDVLIPRFVFNGYRYGYGYGYRGGSAFGGKLQLLFDLDRAPALNPVEIDATLFPRHEIHPQRNFIEKALPMADRIASASKARAKKAALAAKRASRRGRRLPEQAEKHVPLVKVVKENGSIDQDTWLDGVFFKAGYGRRGVLRLSLHLEDGSPVAMPRVATWRRYYYPPQSVTTEVGVTPATFHHLVSAALAAGLVTPGKTGIHAKEARGPGKGGVIEQRIDVTGFDGVPPRPAWRKPRKAPPVQTCASCGAMPLQYTPRGADWHVDQRPGATCPRCGARWQPCDRDPQALDACLSPNQQPALFCRHGIVIELGGEPVVTSLQGETLHGFMEWFQQQFNAGLMGPFNIKLKSCYWVDYLASIEIEKGGNALEWRPAALYPEDGLAY